MDRSKARGSSRAVVVTALVCAGCMIGVEDPFWADGPAPGAGTFPDPGTSGSPAGDASGTSAESDGAGVGSGSEDPGNATAVPDGDGGGPDGSTSGAALDDDEDDGEGDGEDDGGPGTSSGAAGSSDDGAMASSSVGGESDDDGNAAGMCASAAVEDLITASFFDCGDDARVGQVELAAGVTCSQVCCMFGFDACVHQAGQNNPFFCTPEGAPLIGGCDDVFPPNWMYQCLCA